MADFIRKRVLLGFGASLALLVVILVGLPMIGSMRLVDSQILNAIEDLTGQKATISGKPKIGIFPNLHVTLRGFSLRPQSESNDKAIFTADEVRLDLSAWSVINSKIVVQSTALLRPELFLPPKSEILSLDSVLGGSIYRQLKAAQLLTAENPIEPDHASLRDLFIGPIAITSGAVSFANTEQEQGAPDQWTAINGTINAGKINGPIRVRLDTIWKGENIAIAADVSNFLSFASGGAAEATIGLKAAPVQASFAGNIRLGTDAFMEGPISLSTPTLSRALSWTGQNIAIGEDIGAMSVDANMRGRGAVYFLSDAKISLDGSIGEGSLEVDLSAPLPAIRGTLDFQNFNLPQHFAALWGHSAKNAPSYNMDLSHDLALDLRLSAKTATLGRFQLQGAAASLQIKPNVIAIDLNDATLFGGQIQAGLRTTSTDSEKPQAELKILANDVSGLEIARMSNWPGIALNGPLSVSVITNGPIDNWSNYMDDAKGTISVRSGDLTVEGLSLSGLQQSLEASSFFALTAGGTSRISVLEAKGEIDAGNIRIQDLSLRSGDTKLSFNGLYSYSAKSLAMAGAFIPLLANGEIDADDEITRFFVGGSPLQPFISPILPSNMEADR